MVPISIESCPCCGTDRVECFIPRSIERIYRFRDLSRIKYGGYMDGWENILSLEVMRCCSCGHLWHGMQPDQASLLEMYAHGAIAKGQRKRCECTSHMVRAMVELQRLLLARQCRSLRVLDFGSGTGRWAVAAAKSGMTVTAYEPSSGRTMNHTGVRLVTDMAALSGETFDAINLEQVLEHVPAPRELLHTLAAYAHEKTLLRISVPDIYRENATLVSDYPFNGSRMHVLSPYEHLHGFNRKSLLMVLARAGMREIPLRSVVPAARRYALARLLMALGAPWSRTHVLAEVATAK